MDALKKTLKRLLINACALLMFPGLLWAVYLTDNSYRVIEGFRVTTQVLTAEGVLIDGVMDKRRDCRFMEVVAMLDEVPSAVIFLDNKERAAYSRPSGPQKWGPWLLVADPGQGVRLHVRHSCHAGWDHTELLTTFVVGIQ